MKFHHLYFFFCWMLPIAACSVTPSTFDEDTNRLNRDTDRDSDGIPDTDLPPDTETDRDSDGIPDTDLPPDTDSDADSDTDGDTDSDSETDSEPLWTAPSPRQQNLAQFAIDCDEGDLTSDCPDGVPSPCVPDDPKILCTLSIVDDEGISIYDGSVAIERRGRSSIRYYKPNYSLELRLADGVTDNPVPCMGMGKEADWVLDGSWMDRSFMRNDLVFDIYRSLQGLHWAPETRYGELTFNGAHHGIYRLVERIKRDDDRVAIDTDDGSGTHFIIKQDEEGNLYDSIGLETNTWQHVYPKEDAVTSGQHSAIQDWLSDFSSALHGGDAFDYLDLETTVDYVLLQEFAKNVDGFMLSIHLFKDGDGPAFLVPWDIDLAFGQPIFVFDATYADNEEPEGWARETSFNENLKDVPAFAERMVTRWAELRQGPLSDEWVNQRIDDYQRVLTDDAIAANFNAFPIEDVDFSVIWNAYTLYDVTSYADEVAHFRQWIADRLVWMDANIASYAQ